MAELLRIGEVATALGVSVDTLRRWEADGRVAFVRQKGQRMLPATELKGLLESQSAQPRRSSARNRLPGIVVSVEKDGVMAKVELACGDYRVVSLMSREAAEDMNLAPGVSATAVVKSTSVMVEVDTSSGKRGS
jgi:molybdopterin-binding protein